MHTAKENVFEKENKYILNNKKIVIPTAIRLFHIGRVLATIRLNN